MPAPKGSTAKPPRIRVSRNGRRETISNDVKFPKGFMQAMSNRGFSLDSITAYSALRSSPRVQKTGILQGAARTVRFPEWTEERTKDLLTELHSSGMITWDSDTDEALILDWFETQIYFGPRTIDSAAHDAAQAESPTCRAVLAAEILRQPMGLLDADQCNNRWDAAFGLWSELTGGAVFPDADLFTGDPTTIPAAVWCSILPATVIDRGKVLAAFDAVQWASFHPDIRDHVRSSLTAQSVSRVRSA